MKIDFNDNWTFKKDNGTAQLVCLPHDAMLTETRYASCQNGVQSGYFPGGKYTYSKDFDISEGQIGKCIQLLFEGIYRNAKIIVNGEKLACPKYGYTEFVVDISNYVFIGKNKIEITVDNSLFPNCRWYSGSGIYRPVTLIIRDKIHITDLIVKTVSYDPAIIEVHTKTTMQTPVRIDIEYNQKLVASGKPGTFEIKDAKLWNDIDPHLYTCTAHCETDSKTINFGIRKLEWSSKTGFCINGVQTLLKGGCIHHDNGVLGACSFYDAEERRVRILKENGFNALRISHNPASRALLDACDKYGMYVIDEAFDGWYTPKDYHDYSRDFFDGYEEVLVSMAKKDINHPCVIMYSIGNEVTETVDTKGIKLANEMREIIRFVDDSRPVTCGINVLLNVYTQLGMGIYKDNGDYRAELLQSNSNYEARKTGSAFFNALTSKLGKLMFFMSKGKRAEKIVKNIAPAIDIMGLNYAASRYDLDAKKYPERIMVGTETMVADLPFNWNRVKKHTSLIGDFVWAAWDYIGEACFGDWTYHSYQGLPLLAGQGMIDITGKPLASMAFMQTVWGIRNEPFIAVSPLNHAKEIPTRGAWQFTNAIDSWEWKGYEGIYTSIEVYSDAHAIILKLNDKKIGIKKLKNFRAVFKAKYNRGILTAIAIDKKKKEISRSILKSGEDKTILSIKMSKLICTANTHSLSFVKIEFTDENEVLKPYIEQRVNIEIKGESFVLAGFGSALCKTDEVFSKSYHNSYRGRCLAVFRATGKKGVTKIKISSQNVESKYLVLEAKQ